MTSQITQLAEQLRLNLQDISWKVRKREVGHIVRVGDGIAFLSGLPSVRFGELLERSDGLTGFAFDLRKREVGVVLLDGTQALSAGDEMHATGRVLSVPVGEALLGRVVDILGRPLDGGPVIRCSERSPVEREAPGIIDRQPVQEPLLTGVKIIDSLLPLGRGQRELILGDRATGKTSLALDVILAQRGTGVLCIYTAIGQRKATIGEVVNTLQEQQALEYTIVVSSDAETSPGQQYLAPYAACAMAEHFMGQGKHVLIVYDDLTKHADAYRRISLLLERPPAREAYPADVFYLHSRLLERATRLHDRLGGGSMTALPIASTQAGQIAAYIPTNLISITDGQLYLDLRLFNEGFRPAVDVGLSVSRVGGKAQPPLLRRIAGDLRLLYAQLHELENFARFGADLEPATRRRLDRGRRLREILKQPRLAPCSLSHQMVVLFAVREGLLDSIPIPQIVKYVSGLTAWLDVTEQQLLESLETSTDLDDPLRVRLRQALENYSRHSAEASS
ncbi:MAG: F0F1 ATP synthase subunit alpha [Planctomycetales bacterium]